MNQPSSEVKFSCVFKASEDSVLGTVGAYLNKHPEQKRSQVERGLGHFFYAEALLSQSQPLTREQQYFIQQSICALENQASLIRQFFNSSGSNELVQETISREPDKIPTSAVQTIVEIQEEFQSIATSTDCQADDDDDDIDFGNSGI